MGNDLSCARLTQDGAHRRREAGRGGLGVPGLSPPGILTLTVPSHSHRPVSHTRHSCSAFFQKTSLSLCMDHGQFQSSGFTTIMLTCRFQPLPRAERASSGLGAPQVRRAPAAPCLALRALIRLQGAHRAVSNRRLPLSSSRRLQQK